MSQQIEQTQESKMEEAIQSLLQSLGTSTNPSSSSDPNLDAEVNLAKRILSSSIGGVHSNAVARRTPASLMKKIERSYRKRAADNANNSNNDGNTIIDATMIEGKMEQVRTLQAELKDQGVQDDLLSDVMLLFSRLVGKEKGSNSNSAEATGMRQAAPARTRGIFPSSRNTAPASAAGDTSGARQGRIPQGPRQTDKHMEMALRSEELNLLRECIHSLQHIDGELIQFHNFESSESKRDSGTGNGPSTSSTFVYNPNPELDPEDSPKSVSNAGAMYNGIQIRSGLLPFELDLENRVKHKSTRLLSSGAQDALRVCGEAGWLYSRIQNYIQAVQLQLHPSAQKKQSGVVPRALASALMQEMRSYHAFLNALEQQLPSSHANAPPGGTLTLRTLLKTLHGPLAHLRTLALIVDGIGVQNTNTNLNGGQLLTDLYLHTMHGDKRHKDIATRILYAVSLPWYDLLYDWTMCGILTDSSQSQGEFFIVEDASVSDANLWHGRYYLKEDQIPHVPGIGSRGGLLSEQLAKEILIVGKGLNFIRKSLHDSDWDFELRDILPRKLLDEMDVDAMGAPASMSTSKSARMKVELGFHYDADDDLSLDICGRGGEVSAQTSIERTVAIAASQVHKHILSSLFEQHHLLEHLHGMKEILFLGQGDFICALMDGLHAEFDARESINEIYMISMMNIVHDALRSTNAKFLPKYVTDRVQVRLLSADASRNKFWKGESKDLEREGWDIFTLDYAVDTPLTAIVHPKAMEKYYLMFDMLFTLKKLEWMMNNTWRQSTTLNHSLQLIISKFGNVELGASSAFKGENNLSRMKRLLRKFSMTRQCMLHFLTNLQSYLMFEVLESGWKDLVHRLQRAKTLDEVITSHDEYLDDILAKSLVGEASSSVEGEESVLPKQLRSVLVAAFRFCKIHDKIFSEGVETIQKATEKRRGALKRSAKGDWGFEEFDADVEGLTFKNLASEKVLAEVESISEEFDISLKNLLSMLSARINGNSVKDVDVSSPIARPSQTVESDRADASKNDSLRFLTFRLDFSAYYGL